MKFVSFTIIAAAAAASASGHTIHTRDTFYNKVNRDSGYSAPSGGGGGGGGSYSAPAQSNSYSAPAQSNSYSAPSSSYSSGGGGGGSSYSSGGGGGGGSSYSSGGGSSYVSSSGYGDSGGLDLTSILIPLLALIGLSLLFPTFVSVSATRRRRSTDDVFGGEQDGSLMSDALERVNDIYMSVVESEECMERIACEIGGLSQDFGFKATSLAKMADPFVPAKYNAYYKQFKSGQNCHKIKCGSFSY